MVASLTLNTKQRRADKSAIQFITSICRAEIAFHAREQRFGDLAEINLTVPHGEHSGFHFETKRSRDSFSITASPVTPGESGYRSVYVDETLLLHGSWRIEKAGPSSDVIGRISIP